jgi:heptosyltransferase-2
MTVKTDCKYYRGNKPCDFHKIDGRICENCTDFKQIKKRILVIKLDALGDVLRTTSILPALKDEYPDSQIYWVTKKDAALLLKNNKDIDRILIYEENYLNIILNEQFDLGICLDAEVSSASILSLSNCNSKLGFITDKFGRLQPANVEAQDWYYMGLNDELKKKNGFTYQEIIYKICGLKSYVYRPQYTLDGIAIKYSEEFEIKNKLADFKFIIGINTGGGKRWECKKWIKEYYAELINLIQLKYKDAAIILFGGDEERRLLSEITLETNEKVLNAECYDSVSKFAGIINLTDIFITPDSLGFHISVALGKYTMVLVGPTSPQELEVYGNGDIIYNKNLDCIACYDSICKRNKECMKTLTPDLIFGKIKKYFEKTGNS